MDAFSLIHVCIIPQNCADTESMVRIAICYPEIPLPKGIFLTTVLHKLTLQYFIELIKIWLLFGYIHSKKAINKKTSKRKKQQTQTYKWMSIKTFRGSALVRNAAQVLEVTERK